MSDRTRFIGGSDISAILGISPWKTAVDLWLDKTAPRADNPTTVTRRGNRLEPYIADMIASEFGMAIVKRNVQYRDPHIAYFAAEIDAETVDENIEIKTVHPFKAKDWGNADTDELPLHYVAQAQWGLGITDRKLCHVFPLIGDDLRHFVVERDDETIAALREKAADFWTRFVEPKVRPPLDFGTSLTTDTLRRLYPGTDGSTVVANAMQEHWRAVLQTACDARDRYEGVVEGARMHLLSEMGSAAFLRFDDGKAFRRKLIAKKAHDVHFPATSYIDFRLVNLKEDKA